MVGLRSSSDWYGENSTFMVPYLQGNKIFRESVLTYCEEILFIS